MTPTKVEVAALSLVLNLAPTLHTYLKMNHGIHSSFSGAHQI
jgi:hypothetical protein